MAVEVYKEGAAEFHLPRSQHVFYNPRAKLGRDLGVLAMRVEAERLERPLEVLELMAGAGLRSKRYLTEAPVARMVVNDANYESFSVLQQHVGDDPRVELHNELAQRLLSRFYLEERRFDWVDLDPFGTPAPYVPFVQGVIRWEGLFYVTATDAPVLCGAQRGESLKSYDAVSALGRECHEFGLRILVGFLMRRLVQANMHAVPLFSVFDGYCWRVLLRVFKGTRGFSIENLGFIVQMPDGEYRTAMAGVPAPVNYEWNSSTTIRWVGPLWTGPLHDHAFLGAMFRAAHEDYFEPTKRFIARLQKELDELPIVYNLSTLADRLDRSVPSTRAAIRFLRAQGYKASGVHHSGNSIRTDAPLQVVLKLWEQS
ncbi:tRNA (guanine26-N2/guanine27-N2)-dimethyltransferase [Armatimonadetes bacterium GXS]|nr:tRNA (guanine26-N2/guanine27-N2)-dimethyltransferase [Armatimonadetes bacterium GXS]